MSNYVTIFLDAEPTEKEAAKFYSEPVKVSNGDGTSHWTVLVVESEYDAGKLTASPYLVHSTCNAKYKQTNDKPRHCFGSPGSTNDPEVGVIKMARKDGSGPPKGSTGPRDGRGGGRGQGGGKGTGRKTGGGKGPC